MLTRRGFLVAALAIVATAPRRLAADPPPKLTTPEPADKFHVRFTNNSMVMRRVRVPVPDPAGGMGSLDFDLLDARDRAEFERLTGTRATKVQGQPFVRLEALKDMVRKYRAPAVVNW